MFQLERIAKTYGGRTLFRELSWRLEPGRRIGLIGPNGAGKTTLFRIIVGSIEADDGRTVRPKGLTVGLLPQEMDALADRPAFDLVLEGKAEVVALERRLEQLQTQIAEGHDNGQSAPEIEALSDQLGEVEERFRVLGGYEFRAEARQIMAGMGFTAEDTERSAAEFSGGWRMRLVLSQLLLQRPSILLMDEPTNHLDLPSLEWLENFLQTYEGTVVVISHDRYFLNRLIDEIAAFETDGFHTFPGSYDKYLIAREDRLDLLRRQKEQQDRKIKETERFIERFRYKATKARQVQSRVKQLEKIERIALPEGRKTMAIRFPEGRRPGRCVAKLESVAKRFGDTEVYNNLDLEILRGERVALVGPNGHGKTTLLRIIADHVGIEAGTFELGHQVDVGYFAQHQVESLTLGNTILQEAENYADIDMRTRCRTLLGAFLFSGDDVSKKISVLSGGEKSRVALSKLLLRPSNLLLLDEPTNHLDLESRGVLLAALRAYQGTIILVSHDRYFINKLATRVIHVEAGEAVSYPGGYEYYQFKRQQEADEANGNIAGAVTKLSLGGSTPLSHRGAQEEPPEPAGGLSRKERRRLEAERRNERNRRTKDLRAKLQKTEADIGRREARVKILEAEMADPATYADGARFSELAEEHSRHDKKLSRLYDVWTEISCKIEDIEKRLET